MKFVFLFFFFFSFLVSAGNIELNAELFLAPTAEKKNINEILKDQKTQKLFTAKILCVRGTASSCTLKNLFEYQSAGFQVNAAPEIAKKGRKTTRFNTNIDWSFPEEGPFLADGKESFYEGTVISCIRGILPNVFSPLGINRAKNVQLIYIPALQFSNLPDTGKSVFRRESKWEITVKIIEEGAPVRTVKTQPVYIRGRFPAKNPAGIQCKMYNYRGITVMNMYYVHQRGIRKNGTPVMEEMDLSLCFYAPRAGSEILLADLVSYCSSGNAAFGKLPAKGGKMIRYQVFLIVK